jgi:hypothetical protein
MQRTLIFPTEKQLEKFIEKYLFDKYYKLGNVANSVKFAYTDQHLKDAQTNFGAIVGKSWVVQ